ncbi:hypothetical protein GCM10028791_20310 [Echinicola sediminis]
MSTKDPSKNTLAISILVFSGAALTFLASIAIYVNSENAVTILNIALPVFSAWVGTIIAFYFGRDNFESANKQVQDMVQLVKSTAGVKTLVTQAMRTIDKTEALVIPAGKTEKDISVQEILALYSDKVSRLPILLPSGTVKYMIHESFVLRYKNQGGQDSDTLEQLVTKEKDTFQLNKGFVLVGEKTTLDAAKRLMEQHPPCQDIFITKNGTPDEPAIGWISNVRLTRHLEAL